MIDITECIKTNDCATPIRNLLKERDRTKNSNFSIYREILFLSIIVLEREHIDTGKYLECLKLK